MSINGVHAWYRFCHALFSMNLAPLRNLTNYQLSISHHALNTLSMHAQCYFLKISIENFFIFGCVLYIGTTIFPAFYTQLWGCVLYTGACYTENFTITKILYMKNLLISYNWNLCLSSLGKEIDSILVFYYSSISVYLFVVTTNQGRQNC